MLGNQSRPLKSTQGDEVIVVWCQQDGVPELFIGPLRFDQISQHQFLLLRQRPALQSLLDVSVKRLKQPLHGLAHQFARAQVKAYLLGVNPVIGQIDAVLEA